MEEFLKNLSSLTFVFDEYTEFLNRGKHSAIVCFYTTITTVIYYFTLKIHSTLKWFLVSLLEALIMEVNGVTTCKILP